MWMPQSMFCFVTLTFLCPLGVSGSAVKSPKDPHFSPCDEMCVREVPETSWGCSLQGQQELSPHRVIRRSAELRSRSITPAASLQLLLFSWHQHWSLCLCTGMGSSSAWRDNSSQGIYWCLLIPAVKREIRKRLETAYYTFRWVLWEE